jgi:hypothetical protein
MKNYKISDLLSKLGSTIYFKQELMKVPFTKISCTIIKWYTFFIPKRNNIEVSTIELPGWLEIPTGLSESPEVTHEALEAWIQELLEWIESLRKLLGYSKEALISYLLMLLKALMYLLNLLFLLGIFSGWIIFFILSRIFFFLLLIILILTNHSISLKEIERLFNEFYNNGEAIDETQKPEGNLTQTSKKKSNHKSNKK